MKKVIRGARQVWWNTMIPYPVIVLAASWRYDVETPSASLLHFRGVFQSPVDSHHKGSVMQIADIFVVIMLNNLLNKYSSCWWLKTQWRLSNVALIEACWLPDSKLPQKGWRLGRLLLKFETCTLFYLHQICYFGLRSRQIHKNIYVISQRRHYHYWVGFQIWFI